MTVLKRFPGKESRWLFPGDAGAIEMAMTCPAAVPDMVAIVCHPHPLYDGSMNNKVVTTLSRTFQRLQYATVRFNFRGVGESEGEFAHTHGETEDLVRIVEWVRSVLPHASIVLSGFSFGSCIAARVANQAQAKQWPVVKLVSVAPPVGNSEDYGYEALTSVHCPWLVIQGDRDKVVPPERVFEFVKQVPSPVSLEVIQDAGHFFHGRLVELREAVLKFFQS